MEYKNKRGKITTIDEGIIHIDGDPILTDTDRSRERVLRAKPFVGARVEYNFHSKTGELIYLRVLNPYYEGTESKEYYSCNLKKKKPQSYGTNDFIFGLGGGGEMANMALMSHDPYDEFWDGDTI